MRPRPRARTRSRTPPMRSHALTRLLTNSRTLDLTNWTANEVPCPCSLTHEFTRSRTLDLTTGSSSLLFLASLAEKQVVQRDECAWTPEHHLVIRKSPELGLHLYYFVSFCMVREIVDAAATKRENKIGRETDINRPRE